MRACHGHLPPTGSPRAGGAVGELGQRERRVWGLFCPTVRPPRLMGSRATRPTATPRPGLPVLPHSRPPTQSSRPLRGMSPAAPGTTRADARSSPAAAQQLSHLCQGPPLGRAEPGARSRRSQGRHGAHSRRKGRLSTGKRAPADAVGQPAFSLNNCVHSFGRAGPRLFSGVAGGWALGRVGFSSFCTWLPDSEHRLNAGGAQA